ncbi:hypothetical protein KPL50_25280, partial [Clostridium sp. CF012]
MCLTSALAYHDLTTINPWQYEIAIERSSKVIITEYPPIKLLYFSQKQGKKNVGQNQVITYYFNVDKCKNCAKKNGCYKEDA